MTHSEALKLALDALGKWSSGRDMDAVELNDLIATLEAALEQPEQKPYCYVYEYDSAFGLHQKFYPGPYNGKQKPDRTVPVYTHPPRREWRGLTEEEIYPLYSEPSSDAEMVEFARAIEAALKERNHE
jgi:hypothetical protein